MKCILHIGVEKTGTTTIQEFLHLNRAYLQQHGVALTKCAGLRANDGLVLAAYNADRMDMFRAKNGLTSDQDLQRHRRDLAGKLRAELAAIGPTQTVLFSSELIQSRLRTVDELDRLKAMLDGLGFSEFRILVYLREQTGLAASLYSTAVMNGYDKDCPPGPDHEHFENICDHKRTLLRFRSVFGDQAVEPRIFEESAFVGGTLVTDFMAGIGLAAAAGRMAIPEAQNSRLSLLAIELLRRINRELPMLEQDGRPNRHRKGLAQSIRQAFHSGPGYVLPSELRLAYEKAFAEGNEWVRREYFPSRKHLFMPTVVPGNGHESIDGQQFDAIAAFLSQVWLEKSKAEVGMTDFMPYRVVERLHRLKARLWR